MRYAHLMEVETGYRSGSPWHALPGEPRPGYDPAATTLHQRRLAKVAEMTGLGADPAVMLGLARISERTLLRWAVRSAAGPGSPGASTGTGYGEAAGITR